MRRGYGAVALVSGALAASLIEGVPPRLPGIALGSMVLLHAERTLAALAIVVAVATLLVRAAQGRLPVEVSTTGLRYEATASERFAEAFQHLEGQVAKLELELGKLGDSLDAPPDQS